MTYPNLSLSLSLRTDRPIAWDAWLLRNAFRAPQLAAVFRSFRLFHSVPGRSSAQLRPVGLSPLGTRMPEVQDPARTAQQNTVQVLMERIVNRDERALEILYDRFSKALFTVVICVVKSREDAEEILCEVFHQVWDKAASYDPARGAVYTWLLRSARNRAIDKIRSKDHKNSQRAADQDGEMDLFEGPETPSALDGIVLSERAAVVKEALTGLSPEQRGVLEAAYFEGYTQSQIAARSGLPLGTVKTRMRDGMKVLQTMLKGRIEWP